MLESPSRRSFLRVVASAAAASAAATAAGCAGSAHRPAGYIDTHTHFYDPARPQGVPWPPKDDALLYRPVFPMEFERLARPLGITRTIVVEASPWLEDNAWVLALAARHAALDGVVGNLRPEAPDFADQLRRFSADARFRGIRLGAADLAVASREPVRGSLRRLAERDLALDVLVGPDQLGWVESLARELPSLRIVIDHCANVRVDGKAVPRTWREGVERCAQRPNVFMKASGLVEGTGRVDGTAPTDVAFYAPTLEVVWGVFGPERVLFGSNWPVSARFATYETVFRLAEGYAGTQGGEARANLLTANARRAYGLR